MAQRFPFTSFPEGWFVIALSSDVAPGELKTVHYFGTDIVLFRTTDGSLTAVDKTCPHLGAHLGGGRVVDNCLRCPFHDWAFDHTGACVDVPYAPKIPPKARVRTWPLCEQNGVVLVHYSQSGAAPAWTPPVLDETGWTANRSIRWELRSHPQEVAENTVDCSHLKPVHHVIKTDILEVEQHAHVMRVLLHLYATGHAIDMPDELNDVHLDVTLHGLGMIVSSTHVLTSGLKTRQRIHPTPIDGERIAIFAVANTQAMPDPEYTREIDQIFWEAFVSDFSRDFPIWENKAYLDKPLLAGGDGPIGPYRKWCRQFYAAPQQKETAPGADAFVTTGDGLVARVGLGGLLGRARDALQRVTGRVASNVTERMAETTGGVLLKKTGQYATATATATKRFSSVDEYFDSLADRFDASAAGDLHAVFQWILADQPTRQHFAAIDGGRIEIGHGRHTQPTVTIEMTAQDYLKMINGELNGALAFSTGRGKLSGPVKLAMRMQRLFPLSA